MNSLRSSHIEKYRRVPQRGLSAETQPGHGRLQPEGGERHPGPARRCLLGHPKAGRWWKAPPEPWPATSASFRRCWSRPRLGTGTGIPRSWRPILAKPGPPGRGWRRSQPWCRLRWTTTPNGRTTWPTRPNCWSCIGAVLSMAVAVLIARRRAQPGWREASAICTRPWTGWPRVT